MRLAKLFLIFALLCALQLLPGHAAPSVITPKPSASESVAPAPSPHPTPTPIGLPVIVDEGQSTLASLAQIQNGLNPDPVSVSVRESLAALTNDIDLRVADQAKFSAGQASIESINRSQSAWGELRDSLATLSRDLGRRATALDKTLAQLNQYSAVWQSTAEAIRKAQTPPEVSQRLDSVIAKVRETHQAVENARADILGLQDRVLEQSDRVQSALESLQQFAADATKRLFVRDSLPIWNPEFISQSRWSQENRESFSSDLALLRNYVFERPGAFLIHGVVFLLLFFAMHWLRRRVASWTEQEPRLQRAAPVFEVPLATAIALSFLFASFIYPQAPRALQALLGAIGLLPVVIILRRLLEPALFPVLYAFVVFYLVDRMRILFDAQPLLARASLLFEAAAGCLFVLWLLRKRPLPGSSDRETRAFVRTFRAALRILPIAFLAAFLTNALGYVNLANFIATAILHCAYAAFLLYALVRILEGLTIIALETRPLALFKAVKRNRVMLQRRIDAVVQVAAFLWWLSIALRSLALRDAVMQQINTVLNATFSLGSISISLGRILAFVVAIVGSFLLSRFLRFVLEEDVYSHLRLPQGVSYAASTLLHYVLIVLGFFIALGALGFDLTKFTILAGAFSVGVGFGLQNIINNFVSGLILLFERPIKVGDVIQVETAIGEVKRIGIRASVIRTGEGSEVIVPNGTLISGQVTNWTLSGRERVIEIQVSVARTSDSEVITNLLVRAAESNPAILKQPAPKAFVTNLSAAAMTFALRAWTDRYENWVQVRGDLSIAVNAALIREQILLT